MSRVLLLTLLLAIRLSATEAPEHNGARTPAAVASTRDAGEQLETSIPELATEPVVDPTVQPALEPTTEPTTQTALEPVLEPETDPEPVQIPEALSPADASELQITASDEAAIPAPPVPALTPEDLVRAARESVGPMVDTLSARLATIERMLADQSHVALETQHKSTQTLLVVAGALAAAILLGGLLAALILARALRRVSEFVVAALPTNRQLTAGTALVASNSDLPEPPETPVGAGTQRFLGAMERLEQRIAELEHTALGTSPDAAANPPALGDAQPGSGNGGPYEFSVSALNRKQYGPPPPAAGAATDPAALWLGKGQALLNLGLASDAVECFEKAVALDPACAGDAYLRRGMALEHLQQMESAIESYDQALAADPSMTLAYLYKGAVYNRLQRYREALDCYDNALQCERKSAGD
jgi:tetratricopeptide (TPR) repeat protein